MNRCENCPNAGFNVPAEPILGVGDALVVIQEVGIQFAAVTENRRRRILRPDVVTPTFTSGYINNRAITLTLPELAESLEACEGPDPQTLACAGLCRMLDPTDPEAVTAYFTKD